MVRNDCPCGSTIGPIMSAKCGLKTVDLGASMWSMHSIREMCGTEDLSHQKELISAFLREFQQIDHDLLDH